MWIPKDNGQLGLWQGLCSWFPDMKVTFGIGELQEISRLLRFKWCYVTSEAEPDCLDNPSNLQLMDPQWTVRWDINDPEELPDNDTVATENKEIIIKLRPKEANQNFGVESAQLTKNVLQINNS